MTRLLLQIAFSLFLVISPFTQGAIELTLQMPSTQSEETHEKAETETESREAKRVSPPDGPDRRVVDAAHPAEWPPHRWAPSAAPSLDPAVYSERRLI